MTQDNTLCPKCGVRLYDADPLDPEKKYAVHGQATVLLADGTEGFCDPCLEPLVTALNAGGFHTVSSCCGHGKYGPAHVVLSDDRWIVTFENGKEAMAAMQAVDDMEEKG